MIPRLDISFPFKRQWQYWFGKEYEPHKGEYLLNHARTGIVMALRATLPNGGRVGVVAYNCHTVANAVVSAGCTPVFVDVTDELRIDVESLPSNLDAFVVTNLFGIRNNVSKIHEKCPKAVVIVDNAHGYGLPAEGDFTVYSINQGKFPALGEGGILMVNSKELRVKSFIDDLYAQLPSYGLIAQARLFVQMLMKATAYSRCFYWLVMKLKKTASTNVHVPITMKRMAPGIRRLYQAWLPNADAEIANQRRNAEQINGAFYGYNAFMAIVRTDNPETLKKEFADKGVETETHFKHCIEWARKFGYKEGFCPKAEELAQKLLMIPTYTRI